MTAARESLIDSTDEFAKARRDAAKSGAWTSAAHAADHDRRAMRNVSTADDVTLSDEHLYWVSELGRLTELAGALNARADLAVTAAKAARAKARASLRRTHLDERWTMQALDDAIESDSDVTSAESAARSLKLAAAHAAAAKEATAAYVAGLSREITLRGDSRRGRY